MQKQERKSKKKVGVQLLRFARVTKQGIKISCQCSTILFKNYKGSKKLKIVLISNFNKGDGDGRGM